MDKWKAKKWFNIYAPELLGSSTIGEMPAEDEKAVLGRVIKVSMSWITNRVEHSFMVAALKVSSVNGNAAHTDFKYLEQTYSYLHSLVKRHSSVIYTVDRIEDKNGKEINLKLMVVTHGKAATQKRKALRQEISSFAKNYASSKERGEFLKDIIESTFQREAAGRVKNIAEINKIEIKRLEL